MTLDITKMKTRPLLSAEELDAKIAKIAEQINKDYAGQELILVGILKGAFIFLADLARKITVPCSIEFMGVASYQGTKSSGHVRITHDLSTEIKDKNILIVEDIVEKGITLDYLLANLGAREPRSLKTCTLLAKPDAHIMKCQIDYVCCNITNEFVIGYGLDLDQKFRELPYLAQVLES